jgi:hypothetical protein
MREQGSVYTLGGAVLASERRGAWWLGWLAVSLGMLLVWALARYAFIEADTRQLMYSLDGILNCISEGRWLGCSEGGKWPLFQYIPSLVLRWLGMSVEGVGFFLCYLSITAFLALLVVTWRTLATRSRPVAVAAVLVLCSGLLIHYANRSFGEMVAAFLTAAFAASWLRRCDAWIVALLAFLTCLTKETAFPFIGLVGATCAAVHHTPGMTWAALLRAERCRMVGSLLAVGGGQALFVGANFFRYGQPYNVAYLTEAGWGPPLSFQWKIVVAMWMAPNSGLAFFWPLLLLPLLLLPVAVWRRWRREAASVNWVPLAALALMLMLLSVLLSRWWAPYGWWAWGSRLILPWLPAVLLIALFAYSQDAELLLQPLVATRARVVMLTAVVAFLAVPHVASIFRTNEIISTFFALPYVCPVPETPAAIDAYYGCIQVQAWENPSWLMHAYSLVPDYKVRMRALFLVSLLAISGAWLWREARARSETT